MFIPIRIAINTIPPLAAACFGGLIALLLCGILFTPTFTANSEQYISNYGKALSSMAAKQAIDATFNHDLVRLQVILQDVIENPHTIVATIHDVENNLLVQAGDVRSGLANSATYTSPIALHDSIAGYVAVTVTSKPWSLDAVVTLLFSTVCLLLTIAIWSLKRNHAIQIYKVERPVKEVPAPTTSQVEAESPSDEIIAPHTACDVDVQQGTRQDTELPTSPDHDAQDTNELQSQEQVFAIVHIKNYHVLKQQLNGQSFRDTIQKLEKITREVMTLYSGHHFELSDQYYLLSFHVRQNQDEALFNASCSAYLILELAGIIDKVPLDLAALVCKQKEDITPEMLPTSGLTIEASAHSEPLLQKRIESVPLGTEDGRHIITGFGQPFQNLLENQRVQLQNSPPV